MAGGGEGPQVVELHEQHLLGGETAGEVEAEVEPAGEAGGHLHFNRAEVEASIDQRAGPFALAEVEGVVGQLGAAVEVDAKPETLFSSDSFELGGDRGGGEGRVGGGGIGKGGLDVANGRRAAGGQAAEAVGERGAELVAEGQERAHGLAEGGSFVGEDARGLNLGQPRGHAAEALIEGGGLGGGDDGAVGRGGEGEYEPLLEGLALRGVGLVAALAAAAASEGLAMRGGAAACHGMSSRNAFHQRVRRKPTRCGESVDTGYPPCPATSSVSSATRSN